MKASLYDYRKMEGGRPLHTTLEVPPDLEARFDLFRRNDWAIAYLLRESQFSVALVDTLSDVVLCAFPSEDDKEYIATAIIKICEVDPPVLEARLKAAIERAPDPDVDDHNIEEV